MMMTCRLCIPESVLRFTILEHSSSHNAVNFCDALNVPQLFPKTFSENEAQVLLNNNPE
jgi:hypothetical protein